MKEPILILIKAKLEAIMPFDLDWLEVVSEEFEAFKNDFSWNNFIQRLGGVAISVFITWLLWDYLAGVRGAIWQINVLLAKIYINIFIDFLPIMLFFSSLEFLGVFGSFIQKPEKKRFKVFWVSFKACAFLWGVYILDHYYGHYIQEFLNSV